MCMFHSSCLAALPIWPNSHQLRIRQTVKEPKSKSTQPRSETCWLTLYCKDLRNPQRRENPEFYCYPLHLSSPRAAGFVIQVSLKLHHKCRKFNGGRFVRSGEENIRKEVHPTASPFAPWTLSLRVCSAVPLLRDAKSRSKAGLTTQPEYVGERLNWMIGLSLNAWTFYIIRLVFDSTFLAP